MLRFLVLLLTLANGAYFAWSGGHLTAFGLVPSTQREPERLTNQLKPEAVRVLSASESKRVEALAVAAQQKVAACLQSDLLSEQALSLTQPLLAKLPATTYSLQDYIEPARWAVYMGKYPSVDAMEKKKAELRSIQVEYAVLKHPTLEPGLSLGVYSSKERADAALAQLVKRGVRSARVVPERLERQGKRIILPSVDDALKAQLEDLIKVLGSNGLNACTG